VSKDFHPSIAGAQAAALGTPIVHKKYPPGVEGIEISLEDVAARVRKGRLDPRVRSWAIRTLKEAGDPQGFVAKVQALLDGMRKAVIYVQDPTNAEYIQAAHETLCLDDKGFCFRGGDCDDCAVALGSATSSVGIPTYVVGQAFNGDKMASHVLVGVEDPQTHMQYHVDPTSKTFSVGGHHFASKEWWIDPTKEVKVSLSSSGKTISSGDTHDADFVGVGASPTTITGAAYDAVVTQIQSAWQSIADANTNLSTSLDQLERARVLFRPNIPFDPEVGAPVQSLGDFPSDDGIWTESMETYARDLLATGQSFQKALEEALDGARMIYADATGDAGIAATSADSHLYQVVLKGATDTVIGVFVPGGAIVAGVLAKLGTLLTPQQVQDAQSGKTGVSGAPVVAIVAGVAVCTVAICYTWVKLEEIAAAKAQIALQQDTIKFATQMVESGQWTADKAAAFIKQKDDFILAAKRADAEYQKNDPFVGTFKELGNVVMWAAIGGVAVGTIVMVAPIVKELGARYRAAGEAKRLQPAGGAT
jgi:hypothetical protein